MAALWPCFIPVTFAPHSITLHIQLKLHVLTVRTSIAVPWFAGVQQRFMPSRNSKYQLHGAGLVLRRRWLLSYSRMSQYFTVTPLPLVSVPNQMNSVLNTPSYLSIANRFEVFTAVTMKNAVFWDVTPLATCKNRRFGRMYRLHYQGEKNQGARNNVSSKYQPNTQRVSVASYC
jgi:hypothetical protein